MDPSIASDLARPDILALLDDLATTDEATARTALTATGLDPSHVAAALGQLTLRSEAERRWGSERSGAGTTRPMGSPANRRLFTREGLEQATRPLVAALHAERFTQAGIGHVADITCGLGNDAAAFAAAGICVDAWEVDPATAILAAHNLAQWPTAQVLQADFFAASPRETLHARGIDGVWADPARRTVDGRRLTRPDQWRPSLAQALALRDTCPALGVKVSPAIRHADLPPDAAAQWVSVDGDVVEAALWCGPLIGPAGPGRSALVLRHGPQGAIHQASIGPFPSPAPGTSGPLAEYVWEPDGAIVRAGLVADLAVQWSMHLIDATIAYLTGGALGPAADGVPLATGYRVIDVLPAKTSRLRAALRARDIGPLTIKKRGADIIPERLRQELGLRGSVPGTIIVTRLAGAHAAILVEPLPPPGTSWRTSTRDTGGAQ